MDLALTTGLLVAVLAFTGFSGWRGAAPFDPRRGPRLVPWRFLMVTAAVLALVLLVHLVNLLGLHTGR